MTYLLDEIGVDNILDQVDQKEKELETFDGDVKHIIEKMSVIRTKNTMWNILSMNWTNWIYTTQ